MAKAFWNDTLIAESNDVQLLEGNIYFPESAVEKQFLTLSDHTTHCPWKGDASYFTLLVNGEENENAAWYYPNPKDKAQMIKGYIAFWNDVTITE